MRIKEQTKVRAMVEYMKQAGNGMTLYYGNQEFYFHSNGCSYKILDMVLTYFIYVEEELKKLDEDICIYGYNLYNDGKETRRFWFLDGLHSLRLDTVTKKTAIGVARKGTQSKEDIYIYSGYDYGTMLDKFELIEKYMYDNVSDVNIYYKKHKPYAFTQESDGYWRKMN